MVGTGIQQRTELKTKAEVVYGMTLAVLGETHQKTALMKANSTTKIQGRCADVLIFYRQRKMSEWDCRNLNETFT
jgi:hypothetical protein